MKKIMMIAFLMLGVAFGAQAESLNDRGLFKPRTGKQVAKQNMKNSVKAGKKTMKGLRKASRTLNQKTK